MKTKRVFMIVLDSLGIGALPDAALYGDAGANTLGSIRKDPGYRCPNLERLGLYNIKGIEGGVDAPLGAYGAMAELSRGKDTVIGHWELCGIVSEQPLPTYPEGFPPEVIEAFKALTGKEVLCNKPYSGTEVIKDYGKEHMDTGALIVYTSADSVFQIAAHEDIIPVEELYGYCETARKLLRGRHGVGRVIARPFVGDEVGGFTRTANRHDYALSPTAETVLDRICAAGLEVIGVGKINDIFAGKGITRYVKTASNADGMAKTDAFAAEDFCGLCFVNLVDFDSVYGHRRDVAGYARALSEFDLWLGGFMERMEDGDVLMITGDHGCDPDYVSHTDHTREYVPLLVYGKSIAPVDMGIMKGFYHAGEMAAGLLEVKQ